MVSESERTRTAQMGNYQQHNLPRVASSIVKVDKVVVTSTLQLHHPWTNPKVREPDVAIHGGFYHCMACTYSKGDTKVGQGGDVKTKLQRGGPFAHLVVARRA